MWVLDGNQDHAWDDSHFAMQVAKADPQQQAPKENQHSWAMQNHGWNTMLSESGSGSSATWHAYSELTHPSKQWKWEDQEDKRWAKGCPDEASTETPKSCKQNSIVQALDRAKCCEAKWQGRGMVIERVISA